MTFERDTSLQQLSDRRQKDSQLDNSTDIWLLNVGRRRCYIYRVAYITASQKKVAFLILCYVYQLSFDFATFGRNIPSRNL